MELDRNRLTDISFASRKGIYSDMSLKRLDLSWNEVSSIEPLSSRTDLEDLFLDANRISDLRPLAALTQEIRILSLRQNQIQSLEAIRDLKIGYVAYLSGNELGSEFICPFKGSPNGLFSGCNLDSPPFPRERD